ncbi:MAG: DUF3726 domain-containing protein [Gammaproteobacteria bacterium]
MSYRLTLSEAESSLRKAARAVGLDWGLAEEAGKTARWLAAFDLPGPELVFAHLQHLDGADYQSFVPDCGREPWRAPGGLLCPIVSGAALADRSARMVAGKTFDLGRTAYPLLLVAALGQAARHHATAFATRWAGVQVNCFADGLQIIGAREDLLLAEVDTVSCARDDEAFAEIEASTLAYEIDEETYRRIDALAFKTYVPASEASRAGAGAGLTDND